MDAAAGRPSSPTLATVARVAGVSLPTASKVLNGRPDVARATRRRVEHVLRQLNYVPPVRRLRDGAELIDVVFPFLDGSWASAMLTGIEAAARQAGLAIVLSASRGRDWVHTLPARRSRGVLIPLAGLSAAERTTLDQLRIPYVFIEPTDLSGVDVPSVRADNHAGARSATRRLLALGHRRIALLTGPESYLFCRNRFAGYRAALADAGVPFRAEYVRPGRFAVEPSRVATLELLDRPEPPTAIVVSTDLMALGVYQAVRERGLRIPDDISVIGFDDLPEARWVRPELTTVRQPVADLAEVAIDSLTRLMRGESLPANQIELPTTLVERGSTGPAASVTE